jgi:hypothetical protein
MGVEYSHGIYVADLSWRPGWQHVEAVRGVLARWGFVPLEPELYVLGDEAEEVAEETVRAALPENLMAIYDGIEGAEVTRIMGPSAYDDIADEDRYIQSVTVMFGSDYKVLISETLDTDVIEPPRDGDTAIDRAEARESYADFCHVYPATWTTAPPRTEAATEFAGVWRCGITIDCGKDVPAIADTRPLPCELVRELEQALGTKVVEQGWFY